MSWWRQEEGAIEGRRTVVTSSSAIRNFNVDSCHCRLFCVSDGLLVKLSLFGPRLAHHYRSCLPAAPSRQRMAISPQHTGSQLAPARSAACCSEMHATSAHLTPLAPMLPMLHHPLRNTALGRPSTADGERELRACLLRAAVTCGRCGIKKSVPICGCDLRRGQVVTGVGVHDDESPRWAHI